MATVKHYVYKKELSTTDLFGELMEKQTKEWVLSDVPRYKQRIFNVRVPEHVHQNILKTQKNFGISSKDALIEILFATPHASK